MAAYTIGEELSENNKKIVKCLLVLKSQRNEIQSLIVKQEEEKSNLKTEQERISYKLSLISKSLNQRIATKTEYDRTIAQVGKQYQKLVETSTVLLKSVQEGVDALEQAMDKKVGTESPQVKKETSVEKSADIKNEEPKGISNSESNTTMNEEQRNEIMNDFLDSGSNSITMNEDLNGSITTDITMNEERPRTIKNESHYNASRKLSFNDSVTQNYK